MAKLMLGTTKTTKITKQRLFFVILVSFVVHDTQFCNLF